MADTVSYRFSFRGGLARRGTIERSSTGIVGGMRHRLGYHLIDGRLLLPFGRCLKPEIADLVDVFAAIAMCDRRAPRDLERHSVSSADRAGRSIDVLIPVRYPGRWAHPRVREGIANLALMLTGDEWTIHFEQRLLDPRPAELQLPLLLDSVIDDAVVVLHSGGLDSLLGMAEVLVTNEPATLIPVSVITHYRSRRVVDAVTESLQRAFPTASIQGSHLYMSRRGSGDRLDDRASEYRTRILPCLAVGIAVAVEFGAGRLQLTENGPGAINLPSSPEQLDAWTTRATHPKTLAAFAELATWVLDRAIRIENTGLFKTKSQLAAVLQDSRFEEAARLTVSCERFPYANADAPCGGCMSCLYRQIALHQVGMTHIDAERNARRNEGLAGAGALGQRLGIEASALALQVARLKPLLAAANPYREIDAAFERIDEVLQVAVYLGMTNDVVKNCIVDLLKEFTVEADAFLSANVLTFHRSEERAVAS